MSKHKGKLARPKPRADWLVRFVDGNTETVTNAVRYRDNLGGYTFVTEGCCAMDIPPGRVQFVRQIFLGTTEAPAPDDDDPGPIEVGRA